MQNKRSMIDAQWQALQPGWGADDYKGERQMLYDNLEEGETIERLWCGDWEAFMEGMRGESHDRGIVVATEGRVLLMNRGRLTKNVSAIPYSFMSAVKELGPGKVRISTPNSDCDLSLELWSSGLAAFLQERILSATESMETKLSRILEGGEGIEHWAHCTGGTESVYEVRSQGGMGGGPSSPGYVYTEAYDVSALAVATDRRILFFEWSGESIIGSRPHGTILAVENWGRPELRFVDVNGQVYAVRFVEDTDAVRFAGLMRDHVPAAARRVSREARISAEWKLLHPLWDHRNNHGGERRKLSEVLEDHEQIEALAWGTYSPQWAGGQRHSGIIAATGRRLIFVRDGWTDEDFDELPYDEIGDVALDHDTLFIIPAPRFDGCVIDAMDDMNPLGCINAAATTRSGASLSRLWIIGPPMQKPMTRNSLMPR